MSIFNQNARSVCGVTVGKAWLRNNPDLAYPEGHENMTDKELEDAIRVPDSKLMIGELTRAEHDFMFSEPHSIDDFTKD